MEGIVIPSCYLKAYCPVLRSHFDWLDKPRQSFGPTEHRPRSLDMSKASQGNALA